METDLTLGDDRTLQVYDRGVDDADGQLAVFWHHGTPNIGAPPEPLFAAADRLGIRWVSYDRPGYGGSSLHRDRDVASAADYVSCVADALGIDGSRSWATPVAARTAWHVARCCQNAS